MKRSNITNLSAFRKRAFSVKPLAVMVGTALLTACAPEPKERVEIVTSVEDCQAKTSMSIEQCEVAYKNALKESERSAPRYKSLSDCSADFGANACRQNDGGSFFMPFMAGWMVSSMLDDVSGKRHYNPVYSPRDRGNGYRFVTSTNSPVRASGSGYVAPKSAVISKPPAVTKTISRGGFGSSAAAKSSWGGGSKSGSFGG